MKKKSRASTSGAPARRRVGRPSGTTAQGEASRRALYDVAVKLIARDGYEATTLREIASQAGVSPGLLYKYFPSKRAVVLELYERLSAAYADRAVALPDGPWPMRFVHAVRQSLSVLAPQRSALVSLSGVLVSAGGDGLFATRTAFSRTRVEEVFARVVAGSTHPPDDDATAAALGRVLYVGHLGILLFWILDRSEDQRATHDLVGMVELVSTWLPVLMATEAASTLVVTFDEIVRDALFEREA